MTRSDVPTVLKNGATADEGGATVAPPDAASPQGAVSGAVRSQPASVGKYRILRLLGEGGMGAVYEAEQDQPRRLVALKVIKAAWASPEMLRRFEQESQALGRLHHPGIAQIYEAGSADAGFGVQPFFAMELIHGKPLVEYADEHKLTTRQRLELMIQVCDAVEHAHQRGIIHRDLKPGNILVDETGQPKILDFGLARATDSDSQATRQTDVGQLLGTLAYMSPEQVLADPFALDTRTDVYALGVILYELLAGKMPYMLSKMLHEAVRTIQETDPAPLSSVSKIYRGDIETIVAKALEKDKNRRYASATGLAADIRRYLHDEPIVARPASASYQLQKFARRNKALVAGVGAVFVVLVLGVVASTWEAVQARRAEAKANQQAEIARAVNDFLQKDLLGQASAYNQSKPDPDMKVRTALDRAAQNISGKFDKQPQVEAAIRETIGNTYTDLGQFADGQKQLQLALALQQRAFGAESRQSIATMLEIAKTEEADGKFAECEALSTKTLEMSKRALGPEDRYTLAAMNRLTSVYDNEGKYQQGEALGKQAVEISRRMLGPEASGTLVSVFFLAMMEYELGNYEEAEKLDRQVLDVRRRTLGPEHPDTLATLNNLGAMLSADGKHDEAIAIDKQVVALRTKVLGAEHPDTLESAANLADEYRHQHELVQAEALDRQTYDIQRRVVGPEHPVTLRTMHNLASDYYLQHEYDKAEAISNQTLEIQRRRLGREDRDTLWTMQTIGLVYRAQGKYAQAEALDRQTLEIRSRVLGPAIPDTLSSIQILALDEKALGKYAEAEALDRKLVELSPENKNALNELAWFLVTVPDRRLRRPEQALEFARRAVKLAPGKGVYLNTLGLVLVRNKLWDEAIATLDKAAELDKGNDPTDFLFLALAHRGRGDKSEAEKDYARGADMASKLVNGNPEIKTQWAEVAEEMGKHAPPLVAAR